MAATTPQGIYFLYIKGFTLFATILRFVVVVLLKYDTDFPCTVYMKMLRITTTHLHYGQMTLAPHSWHSRSGKELSNQFLPCPFQKTLCSTFESLDFFLSPMASCNIIQDSLSFWIPCKLCIYSGHPLWVWLIFRILTVSWIPDSLNGWIPKTSIPETRSRNACS